MSQDNFLSGSYTLSSVKFFCLKFHVVKNYKYQLCLLHLHSILDQVPRSSRSLNLWSTHFGDNCSRICQIKVKPNLFQDFVHREIVADHDWYNSRRFGSNNLSLYAAKVCCIESHEYKWLQTRWLTRIWTLSVFVCWFVKITSLWLNCTCHEYQLGNNLYWLQTGSLEKPHLEMTN